MKLWGLIVVLLYGLILTVLMVPLLTLCRYDPSSHPLGIGWSDYYQFINDKEWWIFLGVALIAQAALLTVPVEMAAKRPVTKRSVIPLLTAASFMMAVLAAGFVLSIAEVISEKSLFLIDLQRLWPLGIFLLVWLLWGFIFLKLSKGKDNDSFIRHLCGWLLKGSILELLVAVPAHIYVRQRTECCAGIMTFMGIAFGVAVMFCSFGPGVYFLFVNRCKRLSSKAAMP